jgi:hypothetical protein
MGRCLVGRATQQSWCKRLMTGGAGVPVGMRWWEWVLKRGRCDPTKQSKPGQ